ncbi:dihydrodipicolinate synthase family protein [Lacrimispora indolis]|uniref:dihydrodipicolinate synthase family protein n=1 Tax=Lacrimispora indolis TaxID=69825 RepID=UPI00045EA461|nr:dihydrodipicolinate synthase family protein [Lacrimispora indolis]
MGSLAGVNPPSITIFNEIGQVNYEAMKRHTDFMIEQGVNGIAYLGTSGEFGVMTVEQKIELIQVMTAYVNHRVNVLVGVGDTCLEYTQKMIVAAQEAGADAVLAVAPYFSIYAEDNIEVYYRELAKISQLPVIVYNFPDLTGFDMSPELVKKLALSCPNIIGIKDTVPEMAHLKAMVEIKKDKPEFMVFCAYETQAYEMMKEGIDGFINATSNFVPQYTVGLYRESLENNEEKMQEYFKKMCVASEVYQYSLPLLLAVKEAVYQKVLHQSGAEKLPGLSLNQKDKENIQELLKKL